jgi:hypothetical protein
MFEVDWVALLLSIKVYVQMVAESNLGWSINVVIYVYSALLAGRIIYVAFGGRNSTASARAFKGSANQISPPNRISARDFRQF